jgi:hypothetical protein
VFLSSIWLQSYKDSLDIWNYLFNFAAVFYNMCDLVEYNKLVTFSFI